MKSYKASNFLILTIWITLILFSAIFTCIYSQNAAFLAFKNQMEAKVQLIADQMTAIFANRCNSTLINCEIKSYDYCQGTSQKQCIDNFATPGRCIGNGAYLASRSAVRFPSIVNTNNLSEEQKQFVCTSALLQNTFQQIAQQNNGRYLYSYFGTNLGSFRIFPASTEEKDETGICVNYDPRFRPWYVTGSSGGKNLVMIIDRSGSMDGARIKIAKNAANAVIDTLSNNDFIGVVEFSSSASALDLNGIQRATSEKKARLKEAINDLTASGSTNYQKGFQLGFQMLNNAVADEYGAKCNNSQNIFLFLTDGQPTSGDTSLSGLKNILDNLNVNYNITLFTYALGSNNINLQVLRGLSCAYKGISFQIPTTASSSQLLTYMRGYYTYLSGGITIQNPIWTQPYEDAFGLGRLVTVSMPVYYQQGIGSHAVRTVLGVAGIDILMSQVSSFGLDEASALKLILGSTQCYSSSLTSCQIQALRAVKCGVKGCPAANTISNCSSVSNTIFANSINQDSGLCCGLTVEGLIGLIIGVFVGILIIIIAIVCIVKKIRNKMALNKDSIYNSSNNQIPRPAFSYHIQDSQNYYSGKKYENEPPYFNQSPIWIS